MNKRLVGWVIGLAALTAAVVFLSWPRQPKPDTDDEKQPAIQRKARVSRTPEGDIVLMLDAAAQARVGLRTAALEGTKLHPQVEAYGRLQEDPSESFDLRAPAAGVLQSAAKNAWPRIGDTVADGALVGTLQFVLAPVDRLNVSERLIAARSDQRASASSMEAARASWERARTLNADNRNVSDRALQEAEVRLRTEAAKLRAALDAVKLLESSLEAQGGAGQACNLVALRGGEVTEVLVQPGEHVESGQLLLRMKRYDRLIARIYLPSGRDPGPLPSSALISPVVFVGQSLEGRRVGTSSAVDPESQSQPLLFSVSVPQKNLRPGAAVIAHLPAAGPARSGVIIPESAVVRYAGRAWIYVKSGEETFVRKEALLDHPLEHGWFAVNGPAAGSQVVVEGAQVLLSEELKSQIQVGEENPA